MYSDNKFPIHSPGFGMYADGKYYKHIKKDVVI